MGSVYMKYETIRAIRLIHQSLERAEIAAKVGKKVFPNLAQYINQMLHLTNPSKKEVEDFCAVVDVSALALLYVQGVCYHVYLCIALLLLSLYCCFVV